MIESYGYFCMLSVSQIIFGYQFKTLSVRMAIRIRLLAASLGKLRGDGGTLV